MQNGVVPVMVTQSLSTPSLIKYKTLDPHTEGSGHVICKGSCTAEK